jgi:hypothetical protein
MMIYGESFLGDGRLSTGDGCVTWQILVNAAGIPEIRDKAGDSQP